MFIDLVHGVTAAEHHRLALMADADNFRLARLAKAARRRARRATPPAEPPGPSQHVSPPGLRPEQNDAPRNNDADRRYAVSR
ncbi:hypothetical protein [Pseudonocardia nigra]|uniref:hypothetical protein n=1 Tax=Pseudonocardia nigra TaxID=1921578 RepID=UPI001C5CFB50|nr:hypothetical protein [Pseudonocardia nigra]